VKKSKRFKGKNAWFQAFALYILVMYKIRLVVEEVEGFALILFCF